MLGIRDRLKLDEALKSVPLMERICWVLHQEDHTVQDIADRFMESHKSIRLKIEKAEKILGIRGN